MPIELFSSLLSHQSRNLFENGLGNVFSSVSGYLLAQVPFESGFAGYKDWFLQEFRRPGYTIEAGIGQNPLPISQFDEIYADNLGILVLGMIL